MITFEHRDEKMKWTVTNLCCTNLAYTFEPCLCPVIAKCLVGVEFPLFLRNLARLFGNSGGRKREGLPSSRRFEVIRLKGFILFEWASDTQEIKAAHRGVALLGLTRLTREHNKAFLVRFQPLDVE